MNKLHLLFSLIVLLGLTNCTKEDSEEFIDPRPQGISDIRWVNHPSISNLPTGEISNESRHTISLKSGFQLNIDVRGEFTFGELYFLVNDDPSIKEQIIFPETFKGRYDGSISYIFRVDQVSTDNGEEIYKVQPGDTFNFYYTFIASEPDSTYSKSWVADIVE